MTGYANGGLVQPRDDGDSIPVMLSRGSCYVSDKRIPHEYVELLAQINGGNTDVYLVDNEDPTTDA